MTGPSEQAAERRRRLEALGDERERSDEQERDDEILREVPPHHQ